MSTLRTLGWMGLVLVILALEGGRADAQSPLGTRRDRTAIDPSQPPCEDFRVESQVTIRQEDPGGAEGSGPRYGFAVSVTVTNRCPEPLEIRYGSFVEYQTNFVPPPGGAPLPSTCSGRQWSFSGIALPNQQTPFVHRVEGCPVSASLPEPPRVGIESGRVMTNRGEAPVPSISRTFP